MRLKMSMEQTNSIKNPLNNSKTALGDKNCIINMHLQSST